MTSMQLDFEDSFIEEPGPREDESDLEGILLSELTSAIVQATDWTTDTLINQIEKGRIQLNPNFQRRDAWSEIRKSKFIESLILGFPIPQLVLAESADQKGKYIVIDGKQRLLSLIQFAGSQTLKNKFGTYNLQGLEILDQLNNRSYQDLQLGNSNATNLDEFENRTIRTVVIRHWNHEAVLYHIFLRLNTGSVQLSPQELRNALHPGPFAEFLDNYSANSKVLRRVLNINKPDFRMRDAELLLRYYSFRNFLNSYVGSVKKFLDLTTKNLNASWNSKQQIIRQQAEDFERGVELAYTVFDENTFRKWKDGEFAGRFNRAVFDVILYHFCRPNLRSHIVGNAKSIQEAFIRLSETDPEFVTSLETTTKSLNATVTRLASWTQALNKTLGTQLSIPKLVNNRIQI